MITRKVTTKAQRLDMLEDYYTSNPPEDAFEVELMFRHVRKALTWKDEIRGEGYRYSFYSYMKEWGLTKEA